MNCYFLRFVKHTFIVLYINIRGESNVKLIQSWTTE